MDTTDGLFMNLAYGWAFFNPVRKVYYNLAITGLSVAICFFIGGIEALSLLSEPCRATPGGAREVTGGQGVAGSNPAVPTEFPQVKVVLSDVRDDPE